MGDSISPRGVDADGVGLLHNLQALTFLSQHQEPNPPMIVYSLLLNHVLYLSSTKLCEQIPLWLSFHLY